MRISPNLVWLAVAASATSANAAAVLPRQTDTASATSLLSALSGSVSSLNTATPTATSATAPPSSTITSTATASDSSSSSSSTSTTSSTATPTTTIPYVEPTSTAIGQNAVGQPNANETDESSNARCTRTTFQVPINITQPSFDTVKMGVQPEVNQTRISDLFVEFVTSADNFTLAYANGSHTIDRTFNISGVYCEPTNNATLNGAIQLLVHGIGFDSSYWNIRSDAFNLSEANYSYVFNAHEAGYATFRYDRLGTGQSERPADGYNLVQANAEVAILENLAQRVRNTSDIGGKSWNKTVLVGHSYGSVQSQRLAQTRPELIDALVLTGFSTDQTGFPYTALSGVWTQAGLVFPERYGNISKHWLVTGTEYADQINFAYPPSVTPNATQYVRGTAGPVTQGAFFTISALPAPATNYTGPVQVVLGEKDFLFAFNNPFKNGTDYATTAVQSLFPAAGEGSEGSIIPATGHGINFHTTAPLAYNATLTFLNSTLLGGAGGANGTSGETNATLPSGGDSPATA